MTSHTLFYPIIVMAYMIKRALTKAHSMLLFQDLYSWGEVKDIFSHFLALFIFSTKPLLVLNQGIVQYIKLLQYEKQIRIL